MTSIRFFSLAIGLLLCAGCSVTKHVQESTSSFEQTSSGSSTQSSVLLLDSLFRQFTLDADSISVSINMPPSGVCSSCPDSSRQDEPFTPSMRITAHRPHIVSEERHATNAQTSTQTNDSTKAVEQAQSQRQTERDSEGVAKPMNGTIVTISLVLGTLALLIGAMILFLYLRRKRII